MKNSDLPKKFQDFIQSNNLIEENDSLLLAISGGVDSMVMLQLFKILGFNIQIAHCNFSLRGKASKADEKLVEKFAFENRIPFHTKTFDTVRLAAIQKVSIQVAARNARYAWFHEIMEKENIPKLATAHHLDDNIETFLINLNRGTGIKGLKGISWKSDKIIRPMINISKKEIYSYAHRNDILFREDESNKKSSYLRNWFRLELLPLWESKNPDFRKIMHGNLKILSRQYSLYRKFLKTELSDLKTQLEKGRIKIESIKELPDPGIMLYEIFRKYGFGFSEMEQLSQLLKKPNPGKKIMANGHIISIDREFLYFTKLSEKGNKEYLISSPQEVQDLPIALKISKYPRDSSFQIKANKKTLQVDAIKTEFPLLLRKWKDGDYFQPLGMKGKKKISDFLIDEKIPIAEKDEMWVLLSSDKIMWIVGKRMDDRFKIDENSREVLEIELI